ncbi:FecR domain-containing protein [Caulobacter segnis]|uniref:FecR family protein n=1 Tax=Caulobacter segnis TaxID=88688 RepID=UPI002410150F|nr:FecR domain-containing protein [Caulobacter segnis]MDG2520401.1 FecR domain-containing protein [Caulobacter segnis]
MSRREDDLAEACDWVARLEADESGPEDWAAFTAWLDGGADRRVVFDQAQALSLMASTHRSPASGGVRRTRTLRTPLSRRTLLWSGLAAAACAALVAAPLLVDRQETPVQTFSAPKGERRQIALEDGSSLWISGPARLDVSMSAKQRHVRLLEGEAAFDVRHDPARPFVIDVDQRRVTVLGTEFNIRRDPERMILTVRRGLVEVAPLGDPRRGAVRVPAGQRLVHETGATRAKMAAADVEMAFAWREGRLVYRDDRLGSVISDLNRYLATSVRLEDEALAARPFSGVVRLDEPDVVIERVCRLAGLKSRIQNDVVVLGADQT